MTNKESPTPVAETTNGGKYRALLVNVSVNDGVGQSQWALARERTPLTKMWTSHVMDLSFTF